MRVAAHFSHGHCTRDLQVQVLALGRVPPGSAAVQAVVQVQWGGGGVTLDIFDSLTNTRFYGVGKENRLTLQFTNNPYTGRALCGHRPNCCA